MIILAYLEKEKFGFISVGDMMISKTRGPVDPNNSPAAALTSAEQNGTVLSSFVSFRRCSEVFESVCASNI